MLNYLCANNLIKNAKIRTKLYKNNSNYFAEETRHFQVILLSLIALIAFVYSLGYYGFDLKNGQQGFSNYFLSALLIFIYSIISALLLKFKFKVHKNWIMPFAYFNVVFIILNLEYQSLFCYTFSYCFYSCVLMLTPIMVLGPTWRYASILGVILVLDIGYGFMMGYRGEILSSTYILDTFITLMTTSTLNYFMFSAKCKEVASKNALQHERDTDGLTQLNNRAASEACVNAHYRKDIPMAFLLIDLDNFKSVNDTYGHATGDILLKEVSAILRQMAPSSACVGRFGGDEFLIFMTYDDKDKVNQIAHHIITSISNLAKEKYSKINLGCSIGISYSSEVQSKDDYFKELYRLSDGRLYNSKDNGKNQFTSA